MATDHCSLFTNMIDLRHHIYSLVAVFLALAVGILIGATFIAPGSSCTKDSARGLAQVTDLEKRFDALRGEISQKQEMVTAAQTQLDRTEQVCKALLPSVISKRLIYRNIAVVQTSGSDEAVAAVRSALEQAGAKVTVVLKIQEALKPDSEDLAALAQSLNLSSQAPKEDLYNAALASLANCTVWAKDGDELAAMEKCNLISASGPMNHWNRLVVIVGGSDSEEQDRSQTLDLPLMELLQEKGAQVVGCEEFGARISYIGAYAGKGISTVDNVEQAAGQMGLVYALAGERGSFGVKSTADRLIPRTLENPGS